MVSGPFSWFLAPKCEFEKISILEHKKSDFFVNFEVSSEFFYRRKSSENWQLRSLGMYVYFSIGRNVQNGRNYDFKFNISKMRLKYMDFEQKLKISSKWLGKIIWHFSDRFKSS